MAAAKAPPGKEEDLPEVLPYTEEDEPYEDFEVVEDNADFEVVEEKLKKREEGIRTSPAQRKSRVAVDDEDDEDDRPRRKRRVDDEDDEDDRPRRKRPRKRRAEREESSSSSSSMTNAGIGGGILFMLIAAIWFVCGIIYLDRIFIYPPILFVIGLIAFIKGLVDR
jgi:hypothetical protein